MGETDLSPVPLAARKLCSIVSLGESVNLRDLELEPDPILARMRAEEPVCFVPSLDMWMVTKWDDLIFMENNPDFHGKAPNQDQLSQALAEIG